MLYSFVRPVTSERGQAIGLGKWQGRFGRPAPDDGIARIHRFVAPHQHRQVRPSPLEQFRPFGRKRLHTSATSCPSEIWSPTATFKRSRPERVARMLCHPSQTNGAVKSWLTIDHAEIAHDVACTIDVYLYPFPPSPITPSFGKNRDDAFVRGRMGHETGRGRQGCPTSRDRKPAE